jgi:cytochrome c biogenesis protein CcdA
MKDILIFCSGADREALEETKSEAEKNKYASIGMIILLTTVLACCSGGCAAYKFFGDRSYVSLIIIIFWGTFIFFLERYFMMSTKKFKGSNNPISDFFNNLTSFFLPVAIRISSITAQIRLEDKTFADNLRNKDTSENAPQLTDLNEKIGVLEKEKQEKLKAISASEEEYRKELKTGYGDRAVKREELLSTSKAKLDSLNEEIKIENDKKEEITRKTTASTEEVIKIRDQQFLNRSFGIEREISALNELVRNDHAISEWHGLIRLILVMIEIAPISLKVLSPFSSYDTILESKQQRTIAYTDEFDKQYKNSLATKDFSAEINKDREHQRKITEQQMEHQRKITEQQMKVEEDVLKTITAINRLNRRKLALKKAKNLEKKLAKNSMVSFSKIQNGMGAMFSWIKKTLNEGWTKYIVGIITGIFGVLMNIIFPHK